MEIRFEPRKNVKPSITVRYFVVHLKIYQKVDAVHSTRFKAIHINNKTMNFN